MKATYARISDDAEETGAGVERQLRDTSGLCTIREWVHEPYVDNDLSAYKRSVVRPEFERMLADLASGRLDGIVVYNLDRLARQPRDLERVIDLYDEKPSLTFATVEGDLNLATSDGRTMARVMVAFANKASADTGRRTARKHLDLAEQGEPVGRRMFGWQGDLRTLDSQEAAQTRKLVDDLLAGVGVRELVRQWNDQGVRTTTGKPWSHQTLRKYLRNPRLIGLRTRHGEVFTDEHGEPIRGTWEPLLDVTTFDRVQIALDSRAGRASVARRGARKYHLTGLLRCGHCHGLMFGSKAREDGRFNYVCNVSSGDGHTVAASGGAVDAAVDELVLAYLTREAVEGKAPNAVWSGEGRAAEIEDTIRTLMDALLAGSLSGETVLPRVSALEAERARLRLDRAQWLAETTGPKVEQETPETWEARTPEQRRRSADLVLETVYVKPAKGRSGRFDRDRLVPVWKGLRLV